MKKFFSILAILGLALTMGFNHAYAADITGIIYEPSGARAGTYVPANSILTIFTTATAVTEDSTITLTFPVVTIGETPYPTNLDSAKIAAPDFTIQELGTGSAPTAPSEIVVDNDNHTIALTVSASSLSTDTPGIGTFVIRMSDDASGEEIQNPTKVTASGTFSVETSVGDTGSINTVSFVPGTAAKLAFNPEASSDPSVAAGTAFTTQPIVEIRDQYDNIVTSDNSSTGSTVTLTAYTDDECSEAADGTLANNTKDTSAGVATFSGVSYTKAETIYLKATAGSLSSSCSTQSITVTHATSPHHLEISSAPTIAYTYVNFNPQPVVHIVDQYGNTVTDNGSAISIEAYTADNFNGTKSEFNGTSTVYATHNGLSISDPENPGTPTGVANFAGIKYNTINTTGIYLCAWLDTDEDGDKDATTETITDCSGPIKVYASSSSTQTVSSSSSTSTTTTTTTSAYVAPTETTTTTTAPATVTSIPQPVKPVSQMTQTEKTSYIMELQSYLITLLQQLFNALKARLGM